MSLVERAAQRLEELRKAGEQINGSVSQTPDQAATKAAATTIERVMNEAAARHGLTTAAPTPDSSAPLADLPELTRTVDDGQRKEPTLRAAPKPDQIADKSRSRTETLDLQRLARRGILTADGTNSPLANELRVVKRPLINNALGKTAGRIENANRIMVTSALPGEGKSFISANLAMTIAMEKDSTVLLVEADPMRPSLSALLGISPGQGLIDLLVDTRLDVSDVIVKLNIGRLSFISAGTRHDHTTELLASTAMENLVEHLASRYRDRILIFDSPPLLATPEARALAQHMGQVVFVVEAGKTTHGAAREALASIESCPVVLPVLNKAAAREERMYYYYG